MSRKRFSANRFLTLTAVFILLGQLIFPSAAWAAGTEVAEGDQSQKPAVSLEKAITTIRDNFDIPKEYTEFSSGLNMYNQNQTWSLNWSPPDQQGGSFSAQVDANTGEIMNMNNWKNEIGSGFVVRLPQIQAAEAKDIAEKLVRRVAAGKIAELRFKPMDDMIIPLGNNYGPVSYTVYWQRLVNNIPFPNDGVTVQVNALNGEIQSYSQNWTSLAQIPEAKGVIPASKAEESFLNSQLFELQYFTPALMRPLMPGEKQDVKLVYMLNRSYLPGAIDALTGEPIKINYPGGYYGYSKGADGMLNRGPASQTFPTASLTPGEQKEIDKNAQLLSLDEAVAAVKRWISIPDNLVLRNSNLGTGWISGDRRVWYLGWSGNKTEEMPQGVSAQIDAATGELLGFNLPYPGLRTEKPVIDRKQAQALAEDFLKQLQPGHLQEVKLSEENNLIGVEKFNDGTQAFYYYRLVNGIPYRDNGLNIVVDTVSKKVISYNLNWLNLDFPSLSGIITGNQAGAALLKAEPLQLMYTQVFNPGKDNDKGDIHLVYQAMPVSNSATISYEIMDAKTGEFLDGMGQPVSQMMRAYHFKDIGNCFAQKEIALLGQAGIFGEYQDMFHPDEQITLGSLLKAMQAVTNGVTPGQTNEDLLKNAQQQGWLTDNIQLTATVTREDFAKLMIRFLKLEQVAKFQGVYQKSYTDIKEDFGGYAALSKGIGMFNLDDGAFEPDHVMTRSEAAYGLVKSLMFRT